MISSVALTHLEANPALVISDSCMDQRPEWPRWARLREQWLSSASGGNVFEYLPFKIDGRIA